MWESVFSRAKGFVRHLPQTIKELSRRPSWQLSFLLIGFLLGVLIHSWIDSPLPFAPLIIAGLVSLAIGLLFLGRPILFLFFILAAFLFGLARYSISFPIIGPSSIASVVGADVRLQGRVINDPIAISKSNGQTEAVLDALTVNNKPYANRVSVSLFSSANLVYGTEISVRCTLQSPKAVKGFDYPRYLERTGIVATCYAHDQPDVLLSGLGNPLQAMLYRWRDGLILLIHRAFPEPQASISAGLLLGVNTLPSELADDFRNIGVSHIFAASGSNVAMVLTVLSGALAYFTRRQKAFWLLLASTGVYVVLAGGEAAVVRAGIMAAMVLLSTHLGKGTSVRNLILLAAVLMLIGNPRLLRDDVGFQLSMLATIGMAVLGPKCKEWFAFMPEIFGLREALSTTVSATVFTVPIMVLNFHSFSFISPIANLLILPFIPYAMAFSSVATVVTAVVPLVGGWIAAIAWTIEKVIIVLATILASV